MHRDIETILDEHYIEVETAEYVRAMTQDALCIENILDSVFCTPIDALYRAMMRAEHNPKN